MIDGPFLLYWGLAYPLGILVGALWMIRRRPAGGPNLAGQIAVWAAEAGVLMVILWFALHAASD